MRRSVEDSFGSTRSARGAGGASPSPQRRVRPRTPAVGGLEPLERRALMSAAVTGFSLVNADTDEVIAPLTPGQVIDLAAVGTGRLNVVAHTDGAVASVRFAHNGNRAFGIDSTNDYSAAGDDGAGDFNGWTIAPGAHTLVAVPFAGAGATGEAGAAMGVVFYVTAAPPAPNDGEMTDPPPAEEEPPPNALPAVRIVSPEAGERAAPGYYVIRGEATDADGSVRKVEYYADGTLVGTASAAPFMISWTNVPAGTYELTAVAHDDKGGRATSAAVTVTLLPPAAGRTIVVATSNGNDANAGTPDRPLKTIGAAAEVARPGDTVLIRAGTYKESVELRRSGTAAKPITFAAETPGTVMVDGRDADGRVRRAYLMKPAWEGKADHIVLSGIKFRYANNEAGNHAAAVRTGNGWRVQDCWFQKADGNGLGVLGNDVTVLRVVAEDNGCAGVGGSGFSNVLVQDTVSRRNNTQGYGGGLEGGGGKWTRSNGLLVERYNAYDNDGPGIWLDIENVNATIRDSALHHNYSLYKSDGSEKIDGIGIFLEISGVVGDDSGKVVRQGALLLEGNTIYDNERQGVLVYATRNVTIRNNVLADNDLDFKDQRPAPHENRNVTILGNQFKNARITADDYTAEGGWRKKQFTLDRNVFDNLDGRVYRWGDFAYTSLTKVRDELGFEQGGTRGPVTFEPVTIPDPVVPGAA